MKTALDFAKEMVQSKLYFETQGPNRSPALDSLSNEFGVPLGSSWCALFVSKAFKSAAQAGATGDPFHYTAGSQDLLAWFKNNHTVSTNPDDLLKWKGALIIRTDPGGEHGHVALVSGRVTSTKSKVLSLLTIEGNTNTNGSSNGDGAYCRTRLVPLQPYEWHFCNTTNIKGGSWWE